MNPAASTREAELEAYLHEHIPISAAMGIAVVDAAPASLRLRAPLEPNINHRSTVFGGSAAAVAILAGWALLHTLLRDDGHGSRIVIQSSAVDYRHPIDGAFDAVAHPPDASTWNRFERTLRRRGRARIDLEVTLEFDARTVGDLRGSYVVLPQAATHPTNP